MPPIGDDAEAWAPVPGQAGRAAPESAPRPGGAAAERSTRPAVAPGRRRAALAPGTKDPRLTASRGTSLEAESNEVCHVPSSSRHRAVNRPGEGRAVRAQHHGADGGSHVFGRCTNTAGRETLR